MRLVAQTVKESERQADVVERRTHRIARIDGTVAHDVAVTEIVTPLQHQFPFAHDDIETDAAEKSVPERVIFTSVM